MDEGGGCLQGVAGVEGGDGGCVAVAVEEVAVGGWHLAWGSAHKQVVHDGVHSPGCRSSHPLPWSHLPHLCLPSEAGDDDPGEMCHGGL